MRLVIISIVSVVLINGISFGGENKGAEFYFRVGDWKRAQEAYEEIAGRDPTPYNLGRLAESSYHLRKYEKAEITIQKAVDASDDISLRIMRLLIRAKRGHADESMNALRDLMTVYDDGRSGVHTAMGIIAMDGNYRRALAYFTEAVKRDPDDFWAWFYTGIIYEEMELFDKGIRAYTKALKVNPDYAQAVNNLGYCYKEKHFYAYAIEQYRKAIELIPDNAGYYYNIGNAYTYEQRIDDAYSAYRKATALEPTFAKAHYNLARTSVRKGWIEEAVKEFRLYITYGDDDIYRFVALPDSVEEEIETLELYLRYHRPHGARDGRIIDTKR